ncbi:M28 family peptidase [Vicingaceae bacterium]|nr:M28 family peptidase [Vicingaceae bacterium]
MSKNTTLAFCFCILLAIPTFAQESAVNALTDNELAAADVITERSVSATLTFLASDEMGGRGTPSPEFRIATAYVAARFRAAGLTGGGKDESFYQVSPLDTVQMPASGVAFTCEDGSAPENFGMLSGIDEDLSYSGSIPTADVKSDDEFKGPVALAASANFSGRRGLNNLTRAANKLRQRGATAIILHTDEDNSLVAQARLNQQRPQIASKRSRMPIPVLLVGKEALKDAKYQLRLPKRTKRKAEIRNVIGVLKGSDPELSKEAIVISAHLDHLGIRNGEDPIYNGADDNASGVTGVVSLADAFGALETPPKRTLIFMAFWGEERGFLGSRHFVDNPLWPLEKITANVNIEMIGRPEDGARNKAWGTGWDQSDLGPLLAVGAERLDTVIFEHPKFSGGMLYNASDNAPFVAKGVIGHSFSAGSLHADYHQPSDEWQKLEFDHMTAVARGLFAGILPIANGELTPKKSANRR